MIVILALESLGLMICRNRARGAYETMDSVSRPLLMLVVKVMESRHARRSWWG